MIVNFLFIRNIPTEWEIEHGAKFIWTLLSKQKGHSYAIGVFEYLSLIPASTDATFCVSPDEFSR